MDAFKVKYTIWEKIGHIMQYVGVALMFEMFLLIAVILA